jgi:integration host factor subunit alpha
MCAEIRSSPAYAGSRGATRSKRKTSRTVTRNDLATAVVRRVSSLSRREASRIVDCALTEIADALSRAESVKLHEFGTFFVSEKLDGAIPNPPPEEGATIRRRKVLRFKPSLRLKEKVEKGHAHSRRKSADQPEPRSSRSAPESI